MSIFTTNFFKCTNEYLNLRTDHRKETVNNLKRGILTDWGLKGWKIFTLKLTILVNRFTSLISHFSTIPYLLKDSLWMHSAL